MQAIDQSAADRRPDPQGAYFDGALQEEITAPTAAGGIIGASAGLREVLERVSRVAATDSTVLITGETGTGQGARRPRHPRGGRRGPGAPWSRSTAPRCRRGSLDSRAVRSRARAPSRARSSRRRGRFELARRGHASSSTRSASCRSPLQVEAAARAPGARVRARRRQRDAADGRRVWSRPPTGTSRKRSRREVPLATSSIRLNVVPDPRAAAAGAHGRHPAPRRVLGELVLCDGRKGRTADR